MEQILANLNPQASGSGTSPIRIPVYYFLLRGTNGSTIHGNFDIEQSINTVNNHFDGLFEFYVCGREQIDIDQFQAMDLNASSSDVVDLHQIVNLNFPVAQECVKVFFCDVILWAGTTPGGYAHERFNYGVNGAVYLSDERIANLSHELGHYFGLPHTFLDPPTQYVHDFAHPVFINGVKYTCKQTGDGFCDTPADLETLCSANADCIVTCTVPDPLGVAYSPDVTNIMSYYTECANRFSLEQQERMRTMYNLHPDYEELRIINPACALKTGHIEQSCVKQGESFPEPFEELDVKIRQQPLPICNSITNGGGRYQFNPCNWADGKRDIMPDLDFSFPLNGVTTYDVVVIQKHILILEPFTSPFQYIAADANNTGSVTPQDIIEIRRLILGIVPNFPLNSSWRYIPKLYLGNPAFYSQFDDGNPFDAQAIDPFIGTFRSYNCPNPQTPLPNNCTWLDHVSVSTNHPLAQLENTWSFVGVKVGDVNCSAESDGNLVEDDPDETFFSTLTGLPIPINTGEFKKIQVIAESEQEVIAWQMGASFAADSLEFLSFLPGNVATTFDLDNFHHVDGSGSESGVSKINALWFATDGNEKQINNKILFEFVVQANAPIPALESFLNLNAAGVTPFKFFNEAGENVPVTLKLNALNFAGGRDALKMEEVNQLSKVSVAPVPFEDAFAINFSLAKDANVGLQLYHADGRLVSSAHHWFTKGMQELVVDGLANAPSGVYYYSLTSEGFIHHGVISKK
ncbi:MAG: hypothetical protein J0M29_09875 [Chitinophagales bacterium]|nr:hypothetical protein [Chitinophagales bacterium]